MELRPSQRGEDDGYESAVVSSEIFRVGGRDFGNAGCLEVLGGDGDVEGCEVGGVLGGGQHQYVSGPIGGVGDEACGLYFHLRRAKPGHGVRGDEIAHQVVAGGIGRSAGGQVMRGQLLEGGVAVRAGARDPGLSDVETGTECEHKGQGSKGLGSRGQE